MENTSIENLLDLLQNTKISSDAKFSAKSRLKIKFTKMRMIVQNCTIKEVSLHSFNYSDLKGIQRFQDACENLSTPVSVTCTSTDAARFTRCFALVNNPSLVKKENFQLSLFL